MKTGFLSFSFLFQFPKSARIRGFVVSLYLMSFGF